MQHENIELLQDLDINVGEFRYQCSDEHLLYTKRKKEKLVIFLILFYSFLTLGFSRFSSR